MVLTLCNKEFIDLYEKSIVKNLLFQVMYQLTAYVQLSFRYGLTPLTEL